MVIRREGRFRPSSFFGVLEDRMNLAIAKKADIVRPIWVIKRHTGIHSSLLRSEKALSMKYEPIQLNSPSIYKSRPTS